MSYPTNQIPSINPQNITLATPIGLQSAPRDPTAQDNTYVPGSEWQNTVSGHFFKCISSTIAGAVWQPFVPNASGTVSTLTGNSGGMVGPDGSGNINVVGDGTTITISGNPGTNTLTASLVGGSVAADTFVTNVAGPVVPTGAGVIDLSASTSTYTNGATANTIKVELQGTNHAVFVGRGALTPATTLPAGVTGQVLAGVTGADPAWTAISTLAFTSMNVQVFTVNGTYTPTSGMLYCIVECVGGGGGGGQGVSRAAGTSAGGGGGGGGYARKFLSAASIGVSQAVTIGAGGAGVPGGSATGTPGTTGGTTSLGVLCVATGGAGGLGYSDATGFQNYTGGVPGVGTTGDVLAAGGTGGTALAIGTSFAFSGNGGSSIFGYGGVGISLSVAASSTNGTTSTIGYGGGGAGGCVNQNVNAAVGGNGADGVIIVTEFI